MIGGHEGITNLDEGALQHIIDVFDVKSMIDIGCGPGGMVKVAHQLGLRVVGVDGDETVNPDSLHDYEKAPLLVGEWDLAWCVEFLEHIREEYLPNVFSTFNSCRYVFCTANGNRGPYHSNCRSKDYWINQFREYGFIYDHAMTEELKEYSTMHREFVQKTGMFFR
jgi:cyclopropane fatty-acyl-phospholipid synthase-like methyltransferase